MKTKDSKLKTKNNNLSEFYPHQQCAGVRGYAIISRFRLWSSAFSFSFLAFCLSASVVGKELAAEQLDPTNFLTSHLMTASQDSQDTNAPNVPAQVAGVRAPRQQMRADIATVKFAAQAGSPPAENSNSYPTGVSPEAIKYTEPILQKLVKWQPVWGPRQLWRARITVPEDESYKKIRNELQWIIQQIRSVEFKLRNKTAEPVIVVESAPTTEPNETLLPSQLATRRKKAALSDTELAGEPKQKETESKPGTPLSYKPVTGQTLQMLENLSQHPEQLDNPFELAELLFLSGYLREASVLYREALNRSSPDEPDSAQDRAWILFQIGNCLRDDDPLTAKKMYRQVITEYPDSPWTDLAKARDKLIDWYQNNKPRTLIGNAILRRPKTQ